MSTNSNVPDLNKPIYPETAEMAADTAKADSTDRQNRSVVKNLPLGPMRPANAK